LWQNCTTEVEAELSRLTGVSQPKQQRIGLFGGTFDPPHIGHLVTAINVRHALDLDIVILMVSHDPWQKSGTREVAPAADRYALVQAAVQDVEGLIAGRDEIDRGGPSFTADTLKNLASKYVGAQLFTIVGDDAAAGLPSWERVEQVVSQSQLVVVDRPGVSVELPKQFEWLRVESPRLEVSSTDLRLRFADGRPTDYLVTTAVLNEIQIRGMYGSSERIVRS
jgi:nicotinate-nucleotide adenylyltransferase